MVSTSLVRFFYLPTLEPFMKIRKISYSGVKRPELDIKEAIDWAVESDDRDQIGALEDKVQILTKIVGDLCLRLDLSKEDVIAILGPHGFEVED